MSEENVSLLVLAVGTALIYDHQLSRKKKRRKRRHWVKPCMIITKRNNGRTQLKIALMSC